MELFKQLQVHPRKCLFIHGNFHLTPLFPSRLEIQTEFQARIPSSPQLRAFPTSYPLKPFRFYYSHPASFLCLTTGYSSNNHCFRIILE